MRLRSFTNMNPGAVALHLLLTACLIIFCLDPVLLGISLLCGIGYFILRNGRRSVGFHVFAIGIPLLFALLNPLWNQHGTTVLFVLNDRPYTREALIYGGVTGLRLSAVLYWFRAFSEIMDSTRLFYLFRFFSPKLALLFSMAVRNVGLFRQQMHRIQQSQKALGLYREHHLVDDVRGGMRVFSVLISWALENGIVTANSMAARGYGCGKRSSFTYFRWTPADFLLLVLTLAAAGLTAFCMAGGALDWQYYPVVCPAKGGFLHMTAIGGYALLALLPLIHEGTEAWTWRFLQSRI